MKTNSFQDEEKSDFYKMIEKNEHLESFALQIANGMVRKLDFIEIF